MKKVEVTGLPPIKNVNYEGGKPDKDKKNWLCPNCNSRPPGQMMSVKDGLPTKYYCIYCSHQLIFKEI